MNSLLNKLGRIPSIKNINKGDVVYEKSDTTFSEDESNEEYMECLFEAQD